MCTKDAICGFIDKHSKRYYIFMVFMSFFDLSAGIISMFVTHISAQIISLFFSVLTLALLIFGCVLKMNDKKSRTALIVSSLDVIIGIMSILFVVNSVRIIAGIASGVTGFKVVKTIIQTEKVKKFLDFFKPKILQAIIAVLPKVFVNFIDKIKKNKKGDVVMKKIGNFFATIGNVLKRNAFTAGGSVLVTASAGLSATWAVKHIISTGLLPDWASYIVGIVICVLVYGFIEFTVVKYGIEDEAHVRIRKGLKTIFGIIGADEIVNKIEKIENEAIEEKAAKEEEDRKKREAEEEALRIEAEKRLEAEKAEQEAIEKEAKARLEKEEAERKAAEEAAIKEAEAEAKRVEEEKAKQEHEERVLAMMEKLRKQ